MYHNPPTLPRIQQAIFMSVLTLMFLLASSCEKDEDAVQFQLTTAVSPTDGGSISISEGTYESGEEITLTATPSQGYIFNGWRGAITGTENPIKVVFDANKNISATFERMDSDGDGVTDDIDICDDTATGQTVDAQGCSPAQKDTDGDGVPNDLDACADTPSGVAVDENGCSDAQRGDDSDGDGVTDDLDTCPNTPSGMAVDENGCSDDQRGDDSDADGITDNLDECPDTPSGETVDETGCSDSQKDSDGDGITDDLDLCPETPTGETVDENGCSDSQKDSDGDGITDDLDLCAETPAGETVDADGCSEGQLDSDGDGVVNDLDQCPETEEGATVDEEGCAVVTARTFVPDDNFEQQLIALGYDDELDDYVDTENIVSVTELALNGLNRDNTDLTGLEDFVSLTSLSIGSMTTGTIDLGNHPLLERFDMVFSQVEELLADNLDNLEEIRNDGTRVTNAIITDCPKLVMMPSRDSYYASLVLSDNPLLVELGGFDDTLWGEVSVENCASFKGFISTLGVQSLEFINCESVTSINVNFIESLSGFPIRGIVLSGNQNLTEIDVQNAGLTSLVINEGNAISTINLAGNALNSLDISLIANLENLTVAEDNLGCIQVSQSQLDAVPAGWSVGSTTEYALDCSTQQ